MNEISRLLKEVNVDVSARDIQCQYKIRRNDYNSVYCSRLEQWVSANFCVQCEHRKNESALSQPIMEATCEKRETMAKMEAPQ